MNTVDIFEGFSPNDTDDEVKAKFNRNHGYMPEHIIRLKDKSSTVLAGPVNATVDMHQEGSNERTVASLSNC